MSSDFRPIPTNCWVKFLEFKGCTYKSTKASHTKWRCPGCLQSIIFWGNKKEVPFQHIASNLKTMGVSKEEFLNWIKANC